MKMRTTIFSIFLVAVASSPVRDEILVADSLDISQPVSFVDLLNIREMRYTTIYIRAYDPYGVQGYDTKMTQTIQDAYSNHFHVELTMSPNAYSLTEGYVQVQRLYTGLLANSIPIGKLWINVNIVGAWPKNQTVNCQLIESALHRARMLGFTQLGIFTSPLEWNAITGNWKNVGDDVRLWYSTTNGSGKLGETPRSFDDFTPFGNWTQADVKQYAINEVVSNNYVNRDIFVLQRNRE